MISGTLTSPDRLAPQAVSMSDLYGDHDALRMASQGLRPFAESPTKSGDEVVVAPGLAWYLPLKRLGDFVFAAGLLIVSAPLVILGALLVRMTSRGPAFYRQVRLGQKGKSFTLLKLRTMRHNAEAETGPVWSAHNDSRVTPLGRLLRKTHIDEFPQLINVLKGEMSLVGPRPERPEFVAKLVTEIPFYRDRLQVQPGITGLAQLRLPPDATLECVRRKVMHDVYYVRHVNPLLDFKLLVLTAWRLATEVAGFGWRWVTLPAPDEIEHGFHRALGIAVDKSAMLPVTLTSISAAGTDTVLEMDATPETT
jgi:lipopolysaccharide/colanic/teichoic acid biosynthesis glycosyltransferase